MSKQESKIGLCLCGGGLTGAMYEVGCLAAIEDEFADFRCSEFDTLIGASSGAVVAVGLAGGYSAQRLYRALLDPADDLFPLRRQHLLRFDSMEFRRVVSSLVGAARRAISSAAFQPLAVDLWSELDRLYDSLPAGLFTMDAFEGFMESVLVRRGIDRDMRNHDRLMLVANDLDAGERVIFGRAHEADVSVERAVAASCAAPMLFAPVRIGERDYISGGLGAMGHVDVAAEAGCELIVVVNAMVPVATDIGERHIPTGHGPMRRVRDKGFLWVYSQAWRVASQARMRQGLAGFRASHPQVDVIVVEPDPLEAGVFMSSPMNFEGRRAILEAGYRATVAHLRSPQSTLRSALERRGFTPRG